MKLKSLRAVALLGLLGAGIAATQVGVTGSKSSPELKVAAKVKLALKSEARADVLVYLKEQADLTSAHLFETKAAKGMFVVSQLKKTALESQKDLVTFLESKNLKFHRFYIVNMIAVDGADLETVQELSARSDVRTVAYNGAVPFNFVTPEIERSFSGTGIGDNITSTGAADVWSQYSARGKGIIVAGQDTGVDWTHPALLKHYLGNANGSTDHSYAWHDSVHAGAGTTGNKCGYDTKAPCDDDQHGTHTMGTIVGDDGNGNAIGMAPDAQWMACRNMDAGNGKPSTYIECFEFFLAPYPQGQDAMTAGDPLKAPHVINNSWGCTADEGCQGQEINPVLESLYRAGIMVVVSAGNDGPSCSTIHEQPATLSPYTLSVGAHNHRDGKIASFSSRGPSTLDGQVGPDLTAPGVSVRSAIPGGGYASAMWSGTSMAGPHVAGAVALLWSAKPDLIGKIDETAALLRETATPATSTQSCGGVAGSTVPNNTFGYGLLNVKAAVAKALAN